MNSSPWTEWSPSHRRHFQMHFHNWKVLFCISIKISPNFVRKGPIDKKVIACLAPSRQVNQCWPNSPTHIRGDGLMAPYTFASVDVLICKTSTTTWQIAVPPNSTELTPFRFRSWLLEFRSGESIDAWGWRSKGWTNEDYINILDFVFRQ